MTYSLPCGHCGATVPLRRKPVAGLRVDCGQDECLRAVAAAHNADVEAHRAARAAEPKRPRVKRQPQPLWGDLAAIAAFNGIRTDGTGRSARPSPRPGVGGRVTARGDGPRT